MIMKTIESKQPIFIKKEIWFDIALTKTFGYAISNNYFFILV